MRRFFAPEMREAIRIVRDALGPDAVILSNRKTAEGVEVVAAVDYDESWVEDSHPGDPAWRRPESPAAARAGEPGPDEDLLAITRNRPASRPGLAAVPPPVRARRGVERAPDPVPGDALERELRSLRGLLEQQVSSLAWADFGRRHPVRAGLVRRLMQLGVTRAVADPVAASVDERGADGEDADLLWRRTLAALARRVPVCREDILGTGGVVALLGPTGVGKTTTVAKLAARFRMRNGSDSAALLTTDNYRVGAQEQLRTYGHLMGLPVAVCANAEELHDAIELYRERRLILIDTAGMSQRDMRLAEQAALIRRGADGQPRRPACYLVLSAATSHATLDETARAFGDIALDGCVITKIDEATSLGGVLSVLVERALPAAYLCDGQRVPEDLAPARAEQLVVRAAQFARRAREHSEEALEMAYAGIAANA